MPRANPQQDKKYYSCHPRQTHGDFHNKIGPLRHFAAARPFGRFSERMCCKTRLGTRLDLSIAEPVGVLPLYRLTALPIFTLAGLCGTGDWRRRRRAAKKFDEAPEILSGCG